MRNSITLPQKYEAEQLFQHW